MSVKKLEVRPEQIVYESDKEIRVVVEKKVVDELGIKPGVKIILVKK